MEKLAILDCGGQYTKVIDRKVRELGVYSDIFPMGVGADKLRGYDAMILSGGPSSVWESGAPAYDPAIFELGIPTLGICYGMQLINEHFGGIVLPEVKTEYGPTEIDIIAPCPLTDDMDRKQTVLMSHGDAVKKHADGFVTFAVTGDVVAGIYNAERKIIGVQFHPEVDLSEHGVEMLENFLRKVCGLRETYALEDRIETSVRMIREKVGNEKVIVLVSGGVDSAVTAALLVRALHIPGKMTAYLCTGFEGGMLGFTLYPLLYGTRAPFAIVDMGQVFFVFSIYKVLLSGAKGKKALLREAAHSPSLWALFLGVLIGATGFYRRMEPSGLQHVLSSLLNFVSAPTSFLILLSVGYDLQPSEISWKQTLSAIGCRLAIMGLLLAATLTLNRYVLDGIMDPSATILLFALPAPFVLPVFANDPDERGYLSSTLSVMTMITILIFCIMAAA